MYKNSSQERNDISKSRVMRSDELIFELKPIFNNAQHSGESQLGEKIF